MFSLQQQKAWSLCTIPINPVNSSSWQPARNQHLLCKLAPQNVIGCSECLVCREAVIVFLTFWGLFSWWKRICYLWQQNLHFLTQSPFFGGPLWWFGLPSQVQLCAKTRTIHHLHTSVNFSVTTFTTAFLWNPPPHSHPPSHLQLASETVKGRQRSCG